MTAKFFFSRNVNAKERSLILQGDHFLSYQSSHTVHTVANKDAQITCRAHVIRPSNLRAVIQTVPLNHVWTVNFMVLHFHVQDPEEFISNKKKL